MSLGTFLGGIFDPAGAARARQAGSDINTTLAADSPYWQASQLTGDSDILQGAANLQTTNVGADTSAMDADAAQLGALGSTFGGIAQNGGQLSQAVQHQAGADLQNTGTASLKNASRAQSGEVLAQDSAERNWAAQGQNQSRAQILANELKKQTYAMAASHANFEAALAGRGIQNEDTNLAQQLAQTMQQGAASANNAQRGIQDTYNQTNFDLGMAATQAALSGIAGGASTLVGYNNAQAAPTYNTATSNAPTYSGANAATAGYASPGVAMGMSRAAQPQSTYTNPITGSTVNANYPSTTASWGTWLQGGSSLVQ